MELTQLRGRHYCCFGFMKEESEAEHGGKLVSCPSSQTAGEWGSEGSNHHHHNSAIARSYWAPTIHQQLCWALDQKWKKKLGTQ